MVRYNRKTKLINISYSSPRKLSKHDRTGRKDGLDTEVINRKARDYQTELQDLFSKYSKPDSKKEEIGYSDPRKVYSYTPKPEEEIHAWRTNQSVKEVLEELGIKPPIKSEPTESKQLVVITKEDKKRGARKCNNCDTWINFTYWYDGKSKPLNLDGSSHYYLWGDQK